jgi:hypothetical protein
MAVRRRHSPEADWEEVLFFFDQLFINPGFTRGHPRAMNLVWSETLKSGVKKKTSVTRDEELVEKKTVRLQVQRRLELRPLRQQPAPRLDALAPGRDRFPKRLPHVRRPLLLRCRRRQLRLEANRRVRRERARKARKPAMIHIRSMRDTTYCTFSSKSSSPVAQGRERTNSRVAQDQTNKFRQVLYA